MATEVINKYKENTIFMGLYDTIQFSYKLPLPQDLGELTAEELQSSTFQTKNLESAMLFYKVDESGQLFRERFEGEWQEGDPKAKSVMSRIGFFTRTKEWFEPENYTGIVNFYELFQSDKNKNDYWYEANAIFVNGKVTDIKLEKYEVQDNSDRKAREIERKRKMKEEQEFLDRWYIKYTYVPYCRMIRWIFTKYNWLKQKLPPSYKVGRFLMPW